METHGHLQPIHPITDGQKYAPMGGESTFFFNTIVHYSKGSNRNLDIYYNQWI